MRSYETPGGIDYSAQRTTAPVSAANPVQSVGQFGVERNQVGVTMPDLAAKAQADLANKVSVQKDG
jgi:hypothetical protein